MKASARQPGLLPCFLPYPAIKLLQGRRLAAHLPDVVQPSVSMHDASIFKSDSEERPEYGVFFGNYHASVTGCISAYDANTNADVKHPLTRRALP